MTNNKVVTISTLIPVLVAFGKKTGLSHKVIEENTSDENPNIVIEWRRMEPAGNPENLPLYRVRYEYLWPNEIWFCGSLTNLLTPTDFN